MRAPCKLPIENVLNSPFPSDHKPDDLRVFAHVFHIQNGFIMRW